MLHPLPPPQEPPPFSAEMGEVSAAPYSAPMSVQYSAELGEESGGESADLDEEAKFLDKSRAADFQREFERGGVGKGDDLADWCLQIYRDFKEEHQDELKEEARAGRESQMQQIHLKFPMAPELKDRDGADAVMEHYFWHMGGLLGMARGVSTAGLPPAGASPAPARAAKDPVRRKRAAPRRRAVSSASASRASRSIRRRKRRLRRQRSASSGSSARSKRAVKPKKHIREVLLERILGDVARLRDVEKTYQEISTHEWLDRQCIEVFEDRSHRSLRSQGTPIVIEFSRHQQYSLVLGSLQDTSKVDCVVFHWKDAPGPLACKLCLDARKAGKDLTSMLARFLKEKYHAHYDPAETPEAWDEFHGRRAEIEVRYIRHSHDAVHDTFGHGEHRGASVRELVEKLIQGKVRTQDLTPFVVIKIGDQEFWAVFGNRRLKALKEFQEHEGTHRKVKARCLVWSKDDVPASLACKLAMSATTTNDGQFAAYKGKGRGKGKGKSRA